jgi:hypothetical protein
VSEVEQEPVDGAGVAEAFVAQADGGDASRVASQVGWKSRTGVGSQQS